MCVNLSCFNVELLHIGYLVNNQEGFVIKISKSSVEWQVRKSQQIKIKDAKLHSTSMTGKKAWRKKDIEKEMMDNIIGFFKSFNCDMVS